MIPRGLHKVSKLYSFLHLVKELIAISLLLTLLGVTLRFYEILDNLHQKSKITDEKIAALTSFCSESQKSNFNQISALAPLIARISNLSPAKNDSVKPVELKKAYIYPLPPENRGRVITYESYRIIEKQGKGTESMVEFIEWNGDDKKNTIVPVDAVKWEVVQ